jgi:hypothetical protein
MKRKTKNKLKKIGKNSVLLAKKIGTSIKTAYEKRQENYWKPANVKRRKIKAKARAERMKRMADNIDKVNEEALHGF